MNRGKRLLSQLPIANSVFSTRLSRISHPQVTRFLNFSPCLLKNAFPSCKPHRFCFFSSAIVEEILSNNWSKDLEQQQFNNSTSALTHETVVYVLMRLYKDPQKASIFFKWAIEEKGFCPNSSVYSLIIRIFAEKNCMEEFWATIKIMKEKGFYVDEETYLTILAKFGGSKMVNDAIALRHFYQRMIKENAMGKVVKEVVGFLKETDWGSELERKLSEMKLQVSENFVLRILKELRATGQALKALSFFNWVNGSSGFKHNSVTYNGMLRVLCKDESIGEFWNVVNETTIAGYFIDMDTYVKISRVFQKFRMLEDSVKLYEHMMDSPFKPLANQCSLLLRVIADSPNPDLDLVFRVVKKYESTGHCLSKSDYDGIHRALTGAGRFNEAEKIVDSLKTAGYEPDNITYSQLVYGLCKAQRLEEACGILDHMEENGCVPDIKTWTILINGHCVAGELDKASSCFTKMMEKGFDADADLLEVLINGFVKQKRVDGAYKLFTELVRNARLSPWQSTFKFLIENLLGERKLEEAYEILSLMKKQNYPPFADAFVKYISKNGSVEDALEFLMALSGKQYPSVSAYQHVFRSFIQEGRHSEAKDLLFKCPHHIRNNHAVCALFGSPSSSSGVAKAA